MGNPKYSEPTSFEEMEEQNATPEPPVAQDPVKPVETTEETE